MKYKIGDNTVEYRIDNGQVVYRNRHHPDKWRPSVVYAGRSLAEIHNDLLLAGYIAISNSPNDEAIFDRNYQRSRGYVQSWHA